MVILMSYRMTIIIMPVDEPFDDDNILNAELIVIVKQN
jgi:hypothetical protein